MNKLMGAGLTAVIVLALTACGVTRTEVDPGPPEEPPFTVALFQPAGSETMCWVPCWDYVRVTVEVNEPETTLAEWRLVPSSLRSTSIELPPQSSGLCEANKCEMFFFLMDWRTRAQIFPAVLRRTVEGATQEVRIHDWVGSR